MVKSHGQGDKTGRPTTLNTSDELAVLNEGAIPFAMAVRVWLKISLLSFGGPAGQIAVMHRLVVTEMKWVSEQRFLHALNFCMLLPGPEAQQLTIYLGWLLHRLRGGIVAGVLFVLPGAISMLSLSMIYVTYQNAAVLESVFVGVKATVLAIVLSALYRLARRLVHRPVMLSIAVGAFVCSFVLSVPFPMVILLAGLAGIISQSSIDQDGAAGKDDRKEVDLAFAASSASDDVSVRRAVTVLAICGAIWLLPVIVIHAVLGSGHIYAQQSLFFSQMAVVTFGGAYAVLSYMAEQTVDHYGWLTGGEMLDGLGLTETTPGPLIMVTQFVGFVAAYRNPGTLDPMLAGMLGALVASWVTFAPCFLWIFLGAPYIERLRGNAVLARVLSCITAAVVGVILNLTVWFGVQVLFTKLRPVPISFFTGQTASVVLPVLESFDPLVGAIMVVALLAITVLRIGMIKVLLCSSAFGLAAGMAGLI
ncbi:MAG: chromate transporter [Rhodospirillaceae bacterium]|nr:chromate transporter [Rhodospirillaceae bacterium]